MKKLTRERVVSNHLGQGFLTDFWYYSLGNALLAEVSEQ